MRNRISAALALALLVASALPVRGAAPSVADLDAAARSAGNRRALAQRIGDSIFRTRWPAQVNQLSANEVDGHTIVGVRIWGVRFHRPLSRADFAGEVAALARDIFRAAPAVEEIDVWASVPLRIGRNIVVSGDLARPTSRTVFSLAVLRTDDLGRLVERALQPGGGAYWYPQWVRQAFARGA